MSRELRSCPSQMHVNFSVVLCTVPVGLGGSQRSLLVNGELLEEGDCHPVSVQSRGCWLSLPEEFSRSSRLLPPDRQATTTQPTLLPVASFLYFSRSEGEWDLSESFSCSLCRSGGSFLVGLCVYSGDSCHTAGARYEIWGGRHYCTHDVLCQTSTQSVCGYACLCVWSHNQKITLIIGRIFGNTVHFFSALITEYICPLRGLNLCTSFLVASSLSLFITENLSACLVYDCLSSGAFLQLQWWRSCWSVNPAASLHSLLYEVQTSIYNLHLIKEKQLIQFKTKCAQVRTWGFKSVTAHDPVLLRGESSSLSHYDFIALYGESCYSALLSLNKCSLCSGCGRFLSTFLPVLLPLAPSCWASEPWGCPVITLSNAWTPVSSRSWDPCRVISAERNKLCYLLSRVL